jgi:hypothetical protein
MYSWFSFSICRLFCWEFPTVSHTLLLYLNRSTCYSVRSVQFVGSLNFKMKLVSDAAWSSWIVFPQVCQTYHRSVRDEIRQNLSFVSGTSLDLPDLNKLTVCGYADVTSSKHWTKLYPSEWPKLTASALITTLLTCCVKLRREINFITTSVKYKVDHSSIMRLARHVARMRYEERPEEF